MARAESPPFLRPSPLLIEPTPWERWSDGRRTALGTVIPDWDYATPLDLRRLITARLVAIRHETYSGPDTRLVWLVKVESSTTRIRIPAVYETAVADEMVLNVLLTPGQPIGGVIRITTALVMADPEPHSPLAPSRPGSVLWSESESITIESDAARMPIELRSFSEAGFPPFASWAISVSDDNLDAPASAAITVTINRDHAPAAEMAARPDEPESAHLASSLEFDIARRMLQLIGSYDLLEEGTDYPLGSLGESLVLFGQLHFPSYDLPALQGAYRSDPGRLEAALQSSLKVYAVPG